MKKLIVCSIILISSVGFAATKTDLNAKWTCTTNASSSNLPADKAADDKMANTQGSIAQSFSHAAQNCRDCTKIMKKMALNQGVPAKDILLESASTSTYENLLFAKELLKNKKLNTIILVSDPFHLPRAALVAKKLGLKTFSSPAMKSVCWTKHPYFSRNLLKEPLAIIVYKMQNKL